jgi:phosphopantothenoylcysteine decarboxylase
MNTMMGAHPLTAKQIAILNEEWGWFEVLPPQVKTLACGDVGQGGMCDWNEIVTVIEKRLALTPMEVFYNHIIMYSMFTSAKSLHSAER